MGLHIAISADELFITKFLSLAENLHEDISRITIVENANADSYNFDDIEVIERFNYDYRKFANVDWDDVDLYLYNDTIENLKFLTGAAAKSVFSIDLTGYSATLDQMPVIIPRVDEIQLEEVMEKKMVSLPHPQVSQLMYIINNLRLNQPMLYVSVTNIFPVTYINKDAAATLAKQTRDFFNFTQDDGKEKMSLAFDVNALTDVAPDKQINFEGQIKRIMPQVDTVHVNNIVAPVFYGTTQTVSVGLTTGNTIDTGIIEEWLGDVKDFEGIGYKVNQSSPKRYVQEDTQTLLEFSDVSTTENVKWKSVCDNEQLVLFQTVELLNLFIDNNFFKPQLLQA
ncbi:hypothetical protein CJP74_05620 [Psittacicella melopsittaci]|uniref:Aspartate-semialdehyde dehydrogenase n=1 Tax=Psittacicella melopsittaci TaxID=2028576 RepID=A0A3A1Y162_9GAMM|nr:hypothetical protein [Psittacicella melopsittaci]RIY32082.1 hypothetical protein CJP74_05620 [Psittacicella melopsittaci]